MTKEIGKRIADLMKKRNMTQKQLSELLGATEAAVSRYISGDRELKPDMLANVATALHTTSDYLLGIESNEEFNYPKVQRLIARNASKMSPQEKKDLVQALFEENE